MQLETDRLILREYRQDDWESVHIYGAEPDFTKYEAWGPNSVEDTKKFIADNVEKTKLKPRYHFEFAVCLKTNNLLIGGCGLRKDSQTSSVANMGWAINPKYQNHGYATEAAVCLLDHGINQLNLRVIYATCDTRNHPSYRVMEKIGMKRVGLLEKDRTFKGEIADSYRYEFTHPLDTQC